MYKNNQLWNIWFLRSQRISYRYRETLRCPSIYIIDLNQFLLLFLLTITKQKYFSSSLKLLFNYIVFEFTLLLVVRPWYSENYIATISCTWEWASKRFYTEYFGFLFDNILACYLVFAFFFPTLLAFILLLCFIDNGLE